MRRLLVVTVLVCAACGSSALKADPTTTTPSAKSGSAAACGEFRSATKDYANGLTTLAEFRSKVQTLRSDAQTDGATAGVQNGATQMLALVTSGDVSTLPAVVKTIVDACVASGN